VLFSLLVLSAAVWCEWLEVGWLKGLVVGWGSLLSAAVWSVSLAAESTQL
jgi:hypothetical protein